MTNDTPTRIAVWLDDMTDDIPVWVVSATQVDQEEIPLAGFPVALDDDGEMLDCADREQEAIACAKKVAEALGVAAVLQPRLGRLPVILT